MATPRQKSSNEENESPNFLRFLNDDSNGSDDPKQRSTGRRVGNNSSSSYNAFQSPQQIHHHHQQQQQQVVHQTSMSIIAAPTPMQKLTPHENTTSNDNAVNTTITARDESYDYYMEAHAATRTIGEQFFESTTPQLNLVGDDDTFDELWHDVMGVDGDNGSTTGDFVVGAADDDDDTCNSSLHSRTSIQKMNWKANAAALQQQQQQQQQVLMQAESPPVLQPAQRIMESTPGSDGTTLASLAAGTREMRTEFKHAVSSGSKPTVLQQTRPSATSTPPPTHTVPSQHPQQRPQWFSPLQRQHSSNHSLPSSITNNASSSPREEAEQASCTNSATNSTSEPSPIKPPCFEESGGPPPPFTTAPNHRHGRTPSREFLPFSSSVMMQNTSQRNHHTHRSQASVGSASKKSSSDIRTATRPPLPSSRAASVGSDKRESSNSHKLVLSSSATAYWAKEPKSSSNGRLRTTDLIIKETKSSPPDPPSHRCIPQTQRRTSNTVANIQYLHPEHRIPSASPGGEYYDPDDEEDALTNLVITVVGLEDENDNNSMAGQRRQRSTPSNNHLLPPSLGDPEEEASFASAEAAMGGAFESDPTSSSKNDTMPGSLQTIFLMADATSGIFFVAFFILCLPLILMTLIAWDLIDWDASLLSSTSWRDFFQIPMNEDVTWPVRVAQLSLLLLWVLLVKQTVLITTMVHFVRLLCMRGGRHGRSATTTQHPTRRNKKSNNGYANLSLLHQTFARLAPTDVFSISKARWLIGTLLELIKHVLYMINAWMVLMQATDSVLTLLWNMAALEFVSRLDALAYQVWWLGQNHHWRREGRSSSKTLTPIIMRTPAGLVTPSNSNSPGDDDDDGGTGTHQYHPQQPQPYPLLRIMLYSLITGIFLFAYGITVYEQVLGLPTTVSNCQAVAVQFGEVVADASNSLSTMSSFYFVSFYSGIYVKREGKRFRHHGRFIYDYSSPPYTNNSTSDGDGDITENVPKVKLAYCRPLQAWTLSRGNEDPCENYIVRTSFTKAYDLLSLEAAGDLPSSSVTWLVATRPSDDADHTVVTDVPLDMVQIECAKCRGSSDGVSFGYSCFDELDTISSLQQQQTTEDGWSSSEFPAAQPCAKLTWDRRYNPFPDVIWKESSAKSGSSSNSMGYYDDESATISGGVDDDASFSLLVDENGSLLWEKHFQQPVYSSRYNSQVVLMVFVGRRWIIFLLRTPSDSIYEWQSHPERHLDRLLDLWRYLEVHWVGDSSSKENSRIRQPEFVPLFVSDPIDLLDPRRYSFQNPTKFAPIGLNWHSIQYDTETMAFSALQVNSALDTYLHCAVCDEESNPCHSGGFCYQDSPSVPGDDMTSARTCLCRPGFVGSLCESSAFGCHSGAYGFCFHNGDCSSDGECECPQWERNGKSFQVRGEVCQHLPNCWDFEDHGMDCFERGTCSNVGCDNGGICTLDGTCECDDAGKYRGKLCQEEVHCFDYEKDGQACLEKGTCSHAICRGGFCTADGSCQECPPLSQGRFCQMLPDCYEFEIGGAQSDCFETGSCTNSGCDNGGVCQRDGTCSCPYPPTDADESPSGTGGDADPFYDDLGMNDDDTLNAAAESKESSVWFSGKLCQSRHSGSAKTSASVAGKGEAATTEPIVKASAAPIGHEPAADTPCLLTACETNGGMCRSDGTCECAEGTGLFGTECEHALDCYEVEDDGIDCFELGSCTFRFPCQGRPPSSYRVSLYVVSDFDGARLWYGLHVSVSSVDIYRYT
jgi:hypothetical protein